jgi:hypothetical protein
MAAKTSVSTTSNSNDVFCHSDKITCINNDCDTHFLSDVRIDIRNEPLLPEGLGIRSKTNVIFAGNVGRCVFWDQYKTFIQQCSDWFESVILIPGSIEYTYFDSTFTLSIEEINAMLNTLQLELNNFYFLNNSGICLNDQLIWGGCWFTFYGATPVSVKSLSKKQRRKSLSLNSDRQWHFPKIRYNSAENLTKDSWNCLHYLARHKLSLFMEEAIVLRQKIIVVTGFCPLYDDRLSLTLSPITCSNDVDFISDKNISMWIYGGTRFNRDIKIFKTQLRSNCFNISNMENIKYDPSITL